MKRYQIGQIYKFGTLYKKSLKILLHFQLKLHYELYKSVCFLDENVVESLLDKGLCLRSDLKKMEDKLERIIKITKDWRNMNIIERLIKRIIDFVCSTIGIIILSPILLVIAITIKIDSKGPVFFKQERLGKDGNVFKILKFRTMVEDAEKFGLGIKTYSEDPRITKVGAFLRKTSLDELPQLFNVFIGNMSIVGPRPPVPYHPYKYTDYNEKQVKRFNVKPGVTGHAQVSGRNMLTWDERIVFDVEYAENYSVLFDIKIIIRTFIKVFKREDINSDRHK